MDSDESDDGVDNVSELCSGEDIGTNDGIRHNFHATKSSEQVVLHNVVGEICKEKWSPNIDDSGLTSDSTEGKEKNLEVQMRRWNQSMNDSKTN